MTASLDSSQKQPRIVSEEWLAATESEYQETARQVGEILSEIRAQTTRALWLLSFSLAVVGVAAVLFEVSLTSPDGWELGAVLPVVCLGVAPGFYFLFEPLDFQQSILRWSEADRGHVYIAEKSYLSYALIKCLLHSHQPKELKFFPYGGGSGYCLISGVL